MIHALSNPPKPALYLTAAALLALAAATFAASEGSGQADPAAAGADAHAGHDHAPGEAGSHEGHDHAAGEAGSHEGHDHAAGEAGSHEGHDHGSAVTLSGPVREEFGLTVREAGPASLGLRKRLTGEVVYNPDRYAHAVPRVPGIAREVRAKVGDRVEAGQVLAVLESRELAEAKGRYLAALARESIARTNHAREADLWKRKVNAEREYLEAKQALAEAEVERRLALHQLLALGLGEEAVEALSGSQDHARLTRYEMHAPIGGVVVARHIVPGEVVRDDAERPPFVIADLSNVWVDLTVYPKDLLAIRAGQPVVVLAGDGLPPGVGRIDYVAPALDEATRTATARVVLDNAHGLWKPGLFVTAEVRTGAGAGAAVVVPEAAVQTVEGRPVVFVDQAGTFRPRPVRLGRSGPAGVEVLEGLAPGERYVAENAFTLKAELGKEHFGGHGHAH